MEKELMERLKQWFADNPLELRLEMNRPELAVWMSGKSMPGPEYSSRCVHAAIKIGAPRRYRYTPLPFYTFDRARFA